MALDRRHDAPTVVAIAALAFIVSDLSHEALGHGLLAYFSGSGHIVLSYTYLSSDLQSRWISGAGPLVNLLEGIVALTLLRTVSMNASAALFAFFLFCFNLLVGASYLVYSGFANSGDPAVVVAGSPHLGAIRVAMVMAGITLYGSIVAVGGREMRRFEPVREKLTAVAYVSALLLDCGAGLLNPLGLKYFLISALPTTMAANAGMFAMPGLARGGLTDTGLLHVERSYMWCVAGLLAALFFVFRIGPGLTLKN